MAIPAATPHISGVRSAVADTIGAGGSYMAALIYGLLARGAEGLGRDVLGKPRPHGVEGCGYRRPRAGRGRPRPGN